MGAPAPRGTPAAIALDVGGTTMKTAIVSPSGVCARGHVPSRHDVSADAFLDDIVVTARELVEQCEPLDVEPIAIGVAVLGIVDETHGVGRYSATVGWRDIPVRTRLEDALGCPVAIGHDVRAGGLAEATFGAAAGRDSALFVPIGTGLSAAVIVHGDLVAGSRFQSGELGQLLVPDPPTGAVEEGRPVTLETVCSARAIGERYARASGRAPGSVDSHDVVRLVGAGEPQATRVWAEALEVLGGALAGAVATVDPELIVIGGGLSRAGAVLVDPLAAVLAENLPWRRPPAIVPARYGPDAGVVGAALLGWRRAGGRDVAELAGALDPNAWKRERAKHP